MSIRRARAGTPRPAAGGETSEPVSVLTLDLWLCAPENLGLGDQYQVETGQGLELPEALAEKALGPIPGHGTSDLARGGQARPAVGPPVPRRHHHEQRPVEADSLPKGLAELGTPDDPLGGAQPRSGRRPHPGSGSDPLPPLLAPPLEHEAAPLGAHAHEESVGPLPLAIVRLEGPFHGCWLGPTGPRPPMGLAFPGQRCKSTPLWSFLSIRPRPGVPRKCFSRRVPCGNLSPVAERDPPAFPRSRNRRFSTGVEISLPKRLCLKAFRVANR